jgi:hypothetical protein
MKTLLCCAVLLALAPSAGYAANARNPYGNVNHANDAGNDTGDSQVDALNRAQLNGGGAPAPGVAPGSVYAPPGYGYAPPPVAYAYPPPVYYPPVYVAPRPYHYYRYGW